MVRILMMVGWKLVLILPAFVVIGSAIIGIASALPADGFSYPPEPLEGKIPSPLLSPISWTFPSTPEPSQSPAPPMSPIMPEPVPSPMASFRPPIPSMSELVTSPTASPMPWSTPSTPGPVSSPPTPGHIPSTPGVSPFEPPFSAYVPLPSPPTQGHIPLTPGISPFEPPVSAYVPLPSPPTPGHIPSTPGISPFEPPVSAYVPLASPPTPGHIPSTPGISPFEPPVSAYVPLPSPPTSGHIPSTPGISPFEPPGSAYVPLPSPGLSPSEPPVPAYVPMSALFPIPPVPVPIASPPLVPSSPSPYAPMPAPVPTPSVPTPSTSPPPFPPSPSPYAPMPVPTPSSSGIKGAYWPSWLAESLPPVGIPTSYFTHLFYAFVQLDASAYQLSITQPDEQWMGNFTATLHAKNPLAKAFLSIGGGASSPYTFSKMAGDPDNRAAFINSTIDVARKYGFDGLDLDWEFPTNPQDMSNLAILYSEWHAAVKKEAHYSGQYKLLLSSAVYFASDFFLSDVPRSYPADAIKKYVDFVSPMCFDYHGSWDTSVTGAHALLYDKASNISTSYGISSWIEAGVPPEKLVMGLPLYGRTWELKDQNKHGIGDPAVGTGPGDGIMAYTNIVDFNSEKGATVVYDEETVSTYSYAGTNWIGYDGPISTENKVKFAWEQGLGGYFLWALGDDKNWTLSKAGRFLSVLILFNKLKKFS